MATQHIVWISRVINMGVFHWSISSDNARFPTSTWEAKLNQKRTQWRTWTSTSWSRRLFNRNRRIYTDSFHLIQKSQHQAKFIWINEFELSEQINICRDRRWVYKRLRIIREFGLSIFWWSGTHLYLGLGELGQSGLMFQSKGLGYGYILAKILDPRLLHPVRSLFLGNPFCGMNKWLHCTEWLQNIIWERSNVVEEKTCQCMNYSVLREFCKKKQVLWHS